MSKSTNWLAVWVEDPNSQAIADGLNAQIPRPDGCKHNRTPCYLRCGVECVVVIDPPYGSQTGWKWMVISKARRLEWKRSMMANP